MDWLRRREGSRLAILGLGIAVVLFIAVNIIANRGLEGRQVDLTENRLFTLSDGTRHTLAHLDEPINVRLYFSRALGETVPQYAAYYARVKALLDRYVDLAKGKLVLTVLDPEPFSDAEDRAVADGLQGVPLTQAGDQGYFGLAASNSTDGQDKIGFFGLERERFVEYDLTKLILGLAETQKPVVGVLSALPPGMGRPGGPREPLQLTLLDELGQFFTVERLPPDVESIPADVTVLFVLHLGGMTSDALKAIDTFVAAGKPALVLIDPVLESIPPHAPQPVEAASPEQVSKLLAAWGLRLAEGKVVGDLDAARRVSTGYGGTVADYVAWLTLPKTAVDASDPVMASVERLNFATAGFLEPLPDATTMITPLIFTGPRSAPIDVAKVRFGPDVVGILRDFKPEGKPLTIAARATGPAAAAFPGDAASGEGAGKTPINVMVVADVDFVYDRMWINQSNFFGEQVAMPIANNADFIINALENLGGSASLAGLRGRGSSYRPFTLVENLQVEAEQQYRAKEQALQDQLKQLQTRIDGIERRGGDQGQALLTADDQAAINRFRSEVLAVRKQLRDVQLALRQNIEVVEGWVKFINIAAIPIIMALVAVIVMIVRRMRRRRAALKPA
jgi:ABC-type uncharacterized transport system involved in gliding motility, auxiliary component